MSDNENGNGNFSGLIVSAILGAAVGAGLALLYAPRSGKETRELLAQKARKAREKARAALEQGKEAMRREVEDVVNTREVPSFNRAAGSPRARG